jgi:hypothetical protein
MTLTIDNVTYRSPNYSARPSGTAISALVCHTTEGAWDSDAEWLCNPNTDNPVSTHYVIAPDGRIYELVDPSNQAWHAGSSSYAGKSNYNAFSIGLEISHQQGRGYGAGQRAAATELARYLIAHYPAITRTYVVQHRDIAPDRKIDMTDISNANFNAWADSLFIPASAAYRFRFAQVVFTDRRADSPLALGPDDGAEVFNAGEVVQIGDITDGWGWINTGIGFVPMSVIAPC